ncbi:MAG: membrane protein insertase YidC [Gemmatimonadetes bacterium]|nr:MAG: membrane protein insertase YidC [Gemmatimonadota bacterium]
MPFEVEPASGLTLHEDGGPQELRFVYRHTSGALSYTVTYRFRPDDYLVEVEASIEGRDANLITTDLGTGIAYNETRVVDDSRVLAYVVDHLREGIRAVTLSRVKEPRIEEGPLKWAALKSKYFVRALLPGDGSDERYLGGLLADPLDAPDQAHVRVTLAPDSRGVAHYRMFNGPMDHGRLAAIGADLEDVNPYGWRWLRPVIRPLVGIVLTIFNFAHDALGLGYGWILILFGVAMRVVLFPLNQKAMRAQMRNMAVQPLLQEIQAKYKNDPERLQKEMLKLYKEHGFNPFGGCLPMLLPWPVLITLFFVFQNTIELRGVPFLWLPSLSAPDPLHVLPVFLGLSMFLLQWISMRSLDSVNPQMKMMMWMMPVMMTFIFWNFASGLNLYYATANIATLPQQFWIARERRTMQAQQARKQKVGASHAEDGGERGKAHSRS